MASTARPSTAPEQARRGSGAEPRQPRGDVGRFATPQGASMVSQRAGSATSLDSLASSSTMPPQLLNNLRGSTLENLLSVASVVSSDARLLSKKIKSGSEFLSRTRVVRDNLLAHKSTYEQFQGDPHVARALQTLLDDYLLVQKVLLKAQNKSFFANTRFGDGIKRFLRDVAADQGALDNAVQFRILDENRSKVQAVVDDVRASGLADRTPPVAAANARSDSPAGVSAETLEAREQAMRGGEYLYGYGVARDYTKAFKCFMQAASLGYAPGQTNLANMYQHGLGVARDTEAAAHWFGKAADQGNADALNNLGYLLETGDGVPKSLARARSCYLRAAELGHLDAMTNLGYVYEHAEGADQDLDEARQWYERAASAGYAKAQNNLGSLFYAGRGVARNVDKAVSWFRKAAEQDDPCALNNLGICYEQGHGLIRDLDAARQAYARSAELGNVNARSNLGYVLLRQGHADQALAALQRAAAAGSVDALCHLGEMYERGVGVDKDAARAFALYSEAAESGYSKAVALVAAMLFAGEGTERNVEHAIQLYAKAADAGNADAQNALGILYEDGHSVSGNLDTAQRYFNAAAAQNHPMALFNLALLLEKRVAAGDVVDVDAATVLQLYKRASAAGVAAADARIQQLRVKYL